MKRPWQQKAERRPWQPEQIPFGNKVSTEAAFYHSREWIAFRDYYWKHHIRECVICGKFALILDHIIPITQGGARLDERNVQPLCQKHHNLKHAKEKTIKRIGNN